MDNRINFLTSLKDCLNSRNSFALPISIDSNQSSSQQHLQYITIKQQVKQSHFFSTATRHIKIRLQKWLQYLDKIRSNKLWLKSRNKYIKLLNLMCYCECLLAPFNTMPPEGQLPTLRKHEITRIIDEVQRQIKVSANVTRRPSQNAQMIKENVQNQMENIIFPTFLQEQRRFQTFSTNSFAQDESTATMPLRSLQFNCQKRFETESEDKTAPLKKASVESRLIRMSLSKNDENWEPIQLQTIPERRFSISSMGKKKSVEKGWMDPTNYETRASFKSANKDKVNKDKQVAPLREAVALREVVLRDYKRPPVCPNRFKNKPVEFREESTIKLDGLYWQENSRTSSEDSQINTPKYFTNFASQQEEECVEIMSFREKEGENCDCTGQMLGDGWLSELFKKITR